MNPEIDQGIAEARQRIISIVSAYNSLPHTSSEDRVMELYGVFMEEEGIKPGSSATLAAVAVRLLSEYQEVLERCEVEITKQRAELVSAGLAKKQRYRTFRIGGWSN